MKLKFTALAAIYAAAVLDGNRTIDEVPVQLKAQVHDILGLSEDSTDASGSSAEQSAEQPA